MGQNKCVWFVVGSERLVEGGDNDCKVHALLAYKTRE